MIFKDGISFAQKADLEDPLAHYRLKYYRPEGIYLDGNSLGLLSHEVEKAIARVIDEWKAKGIAGWGMPENDWFHMAERVGELMTVAMGAKAGEIVAMGSTTTNLHTLVHSFYKPEDGKTKILADALNFPSDIYAIEGILEAQGRPKSDLLLVNSEDGNLLSTETILAHMQSDVKLILLPSVLYRSGQLLEIEKITAAAVQRDILIGLDCSHSAGALQHHLHDWGVDFAFWCSYKYLNAGPGSIGFLYVHEKHFDRIPGFRGWWGCDKSRQFDMNNVFVPAKAAFKWQISTPNILSLAGLEASLKMLNHVGVSRLRRKSIALCEYLIFLLDLHLSKPPYGFHLITPRKADERSGHIAIAHAAAFEISQILRQRNIIPDFRPPNIIRLAPIAWYNSFEEVFETVMVLKEIVDDGSISRYKHAAVRDQPT